MNILEYQHFHLVGIKGVAMTSLAQLLTDAQKTVTGSDVAEDFVTAPHLERLGSEIQTGFDQPLPEKTQVVVYTAAHSGKFNPQVRQATQRDLVTLSHAEALANFSNQKKGVAVCGVGGKSTVSAMLAWIFDAMQLQPSYSVGVGNIPGLEKTGAWKPESEYFIAEADEYVIDPSAPSRGEPIVPRFSFLHPFVTVCTRLSFDHPDVYRDFAHTLEIYQQFFQQIAPDGCLIYHHSQRDLKLTSSAAHSLTFGQTGADVAYTPHHLPGKNQATVTIGQQSYELSLQIPGQHNLENATAALAVCHFLGLDVETAVRHLSTFQSTKRRFEYRGESAGVIRYDDYAHHPREITAAISAFAEWLPDKQRVIAFQPHTYSRTKQLFDEFVESFRAADTVVLLDIFPSARESFDASITSDQLMEAIELRFPNCTVTNVRTVAELRTYIAQLPTNSAILTLGAGDIYHVHDTIATND